MEKIKVTGYSVLPVLTGLMLMCCVLVAHAQKNSSGASAKAVVVKLKTAKDRTLPYGFRVVASAFSNKMHGASLSKKLGDLNEDLFVDYEDPRRIKVSIAQPLHRLWLKSGNHVHQYIKDYQGPVEFRVLRLKKGVRFDLYSLMAYEQLDCNNCEYGLYQVVNILITISNGQIVDHMTAAFNFGNDLGYEHRFLYVDGLMRIHTMDFVSDEEGADLRGLQAWSINSSGHFISKIKK